MASLDKEGIATLMEGIKTGDLSAATLARACGDTKQLAKATQTFFQKEAAEQLADMSVSQARYLLKTGEQAYRATGGTIRLGKIEILKHLDNFADDIAADIKLMKEGMSYIDAHEAAKTYYNATEFNLYHPEVIKQNPKLFNKAWFDFWGIGGEYVC